MKPASSLNLTANPVIQTASREKVDARSSNLRIKKEFSDKERDDFLDSTFNYIANFFEASLEELRYRNAEIETRFRRIDQNHFTASVYSGGVKRTSCSIWLSMGEKLVEGIAYSAGDSGATSGFNELLSLEDNGYSLLLKSMVGSFGSSDSRLTQQGGAELLWSIFIRPIQ